MITDYFLLKNQQVKWFGESLSDFNHYYSLWLNFCEVCTFRVLYYIYIYIWFILEKTWRNIQRISKCVKFFNKLYLYILLYVIEFLMINRTNSVTRSRCIWKADHQILYHMLDDLFRIVILMSWIIFIKANKG